jgi:hypothetical protein
VLFYNSSGSYVSTGVAASTSGYIANWTKLAGYVPVPATACYAIIQCIVIYTEISGGYWDVDSVQIQHVVNQSGNNQQTTMAQTVVSSDYSALQAVSTVDASMSFYGKNYLEMLAPDGLAEFYSSVGSGIAVTSVRAGSPSPSSTFRAVLITAVTNAVAAVSISEGNTTWTGVDTTISGHLVKGGIVVS